MQCECFVGTALDGRIEFDVPMARYTSFRIGGNAEYFVNLRSTDELLCCIDMAKQMGKPWQVIGNGSNLLVGDGGIDGFVLRIAEGMSRMEILGCNVLVQAGVHLSHVAKKTVELGLMGLEWAVGIPGTIGGAVAMNAGAYGGEIAATLASVTGIFEGELITVKASSDDFGYRRSRFSAPDFLVCEAKLELSLDDGMATSRMQDFMSRRKDKQPLAYPSAGSTFKRPDGYFAGALIEQTGLKGVSIGGAMVSEKHAGFIINTGGATCDDVLNLIELVQRRVFEKFSVMLETEVKFIGKR